VPVLVKSAQMMVDALPSAVGQHQQQAFVKLYPTLSTNGRISVQSSQQHEVRVYDLHGRQVEFFAKKSGNYELWLREKGVYIVRFKNRQGQVQAERVVVQ
jgi:hypothetical protein